MSSRPPHATGTRSPVVAQALVLAAAGIAAIAVLVLTVHVRPEDSAFVHLYEATSLLAGDHPYRDFFEWGAPLPAYLSAAAQWLVGYRLIGEVVLQWAFIVAGIVIAFHLGLTLSGSWASTLLAIPVTILVLATTPTHHYTKLFVFPLALWMAWRYLDRPSILRSAALGAVTGAAFLFRHDYGLWVGLASMLALVFGHRHADASSRLRTMVTSGAACAVVTTLVLLPWAAAVHLSEGIPEYVQARSEKYESAGNPYRTMLSIDAFRQLRPASLPPPTPGIVELVWASGVDRDMQQHYEEQFGLRSRTSAGDSARVRYEAVNLHDVNLLELREAIDEVSGLDWNRLIEARYRLPTRDTASLWLAQMALLVPVFLIAAAASTAWRARSRSLPIPPDAAKMLLSGIVLAVVDQALFRQPSYVQAVAPLTAALSTRFLTWAPGMRSAAAEAVAPRPLGSMARRVGRVAALLLLLVSTLMALVAARGVSLFARPLAESVEAATSSMARLVVSPPDGGSLLFDYLRACTAAGDRLLVGGTTPFYVNYFTGRPMAGGHLYWHSWWRDDPVREAESLALLQRQSVPFAVSSSDPIIDDFRRYPRIRSYLLEHYIELDGTDGRVLVDTRRRRVRNFGADAWPCFR